MRMIFRKILGIGFLFIVANCVFASEAQDDKNIDEQIKDSVFDTYIAEKSEEISDEDYDESVKQKSKQLISYIVDTYLEKLQSPNLSLAVKKKYFKDCFNKYFYVRNISGFVLGKYVRDIKNLNPDADEVEKKAEIEEYKREFMEYFIEKVTDVYTRQFDNFRGVKVDISSVDITKYGRKKMYVVTTMIDLDPTTPADDKDAVKMTWSLEVDKNSYLKITDVNISGISLRTTLQGVVQSEIGDKFAGDVNAYIDQKYKEISEGQK